MLAQRTQNMTPSATIELSAQIARMKENGQDIIKMNIGEPDFVPAEHVARAAIDAVKQHYSKYAPVPGYSSLRNAICEKLKRDNHLEYDPEEICVSTGAKQAIANAVLALCDPGDEVILPTPCWVSYEQIVKLAGAVPVFVPCLQDSGFELDLKGIADAITSRTKAIIICTPNNPTGAVYHEKELKKLAELVVDADLYLISDEIYEKIIYDGATHISVASLSEQIWQRSITVNGFSKAYAIPGWRLGYSAAPREVAAGIRMLQGHITSSANTIAQMAGLEALTGPQDSLSDMRQAYAQRRDYVMSALEQIPDLKVYKPQGTFYVFPDVGAFLGRTFQGTVIRDSSTLAAYLLQEAHVAVVPGEAFRLPGYLRLSYSCSMDDLEKAMARIQAALGRLQ